jgi:hypothetical protein
LTQDVAVAQSEAEAAGLQRCGNGTTAGPTGTLFFAAGINDEADGLFGSVLAAPEDHD